MCAKRTLVAAKLLDEAEREKMCAAPLTASQRQAMRRSLKRGDVLEPAAGIYARHGYWGELSEEQKAWHKMRGLAKLHPDWVFAGPSAGLVYGLSVGYSALELVCVAASAAIKARRMRGVTRVVVSNDKTATRGGLRVTSFIRTVYDCMRGVGFGQALAIADSALRQKGMTAERLAYNLKEVCRRMRGIMRVVQIARLADARSESGGESIARAAMMHIGVELPDLQVEVPDLVDGGKVWRVDFVWSLADGTRVFGEFDGKVKYVNPSMTKGRSTTDVLLRERRREAHITAGEHPVKVMRFAYQDVMDTAKFERLLASYGIVRTQVPAGVMTEWP